MANFVRTKFGMHYVNLDHYVSITLPEKVDDQTMLVEDKDGRILRLPCVHVEDVIEAMKPVIPAAPNTWAMIVWTDGVSTSIGYQPILGWRDHYGFVDPIFHQELAKDCEFAFLETPDGKYMSLDYDGGVFDNVGEIGEHVRQTVKDREEWKRNREKAKVKVAK